MSSSEPASHFLLDGPWDGRHQERFDQMWAHYTRHPERGVRLIGKKPNRMIRIRGSHVVTVDHEMGGWDFRLIRAVRAFHARLRAEYEWLRGYAATWFE